MPPSLTLYDMETALVELCQQLEAADSDAEREALALRVSDYLTATEDKRDRFVQFLRHLQQQAFLAQQEEDRLAGRRKRFTRLLERLEGYALLTMTATGTDALEGNTSTMRRRQNPPSVVIEHEALIPLGFLRRREPEPNKTAIKKAIQEGREVPGARLTQTERLEIL